MIFVKRTYVHLKTKFHGKTPFSNKILGFPEPEKALLYKAKFCFIKTPLLINPLSIQGKTFIHSDLLRESAY